MQKMINSVALLSDWIGQMEENAKGQFNYLGLTLTQMHYIETIYSLDNPNITELAVALKLSKPTVKVAIDKLIEKEFVYKVQSDADRRSAHLHLTEKGMLINRMHDLAHNRIAEQISAKLNSEEQKLFIHLIDKVFKND